jgi:purine-nucleoside/S-methyl-5'-thioadenosine phosphorylase / adenosine deaminase
VTPLALQEAPAERGGQACYELAPWRERFGLVAGITTRAADFGLASPAPTAAVVHRWLSFHARLAPAFASVVVARQCHGTTIATHEHTDRAWHVLDATDAHLTAQTGVLLTVTVADCVPVYLAQMHGPWLALLHAGWRGVAQGMVERGIEGLARRASCTASDIVIHCGVSICGSCYEVGPEVVAAVAGRSVGGPTLLDLRAEIADRAERVGVGELSVSPWCTAHDAAAFHSHRRSRGADGRMVAYLGRPLA